MPSATPETRYARSGEVNIAYQVVGDGPFDLIWVPGWISNVEASWEIPEYAHFLDRLASFSRLILFDKRGTGLSDPVALDRLPSLEQRMDDVRAVLDAAGSERAALFGASEGGNLSRPLRCDISGSRSGARPARSIRQAGLEPGLSLGTDRGGPRPSDSGDRRRLGYARERRPDRGGLVTGAASALRDVLPA